MAGQFASALMFIMVLIATIIVGIFFLAYVGRCLVTIVEDTAGGNDEVTWPDEPFQDWIAGVVLLVWLLSIWLVPYGLFLRVAKPAVVADNPVLGVIGGALVLWAFFPISLLSSLASQSRWNFIHLRIIGGMVRLAPWTLLFYGLSLLVGAVGLGVWIGAIILFPMIFLPVGAFVGAVGILLYARLLGRFAHKISVLQPLNRVKPKQPPPELPPLEVELVRVNDPWSSPKMPRKKKTQDKVAEPTPAQVLPPPRVSTAAGVDDEWEVGGTYGVGDEPVRSGPSQTELYAAPPPPDEDEEDEEEPEEVQEESPRTRKRKGKRKEKEEKKGEVRPGLWSFPFYSSTRRALAFLSIVGAIFAALLQGMVLLLPS